MAPLPGLDAVAPKGFTAGVVAAAAPKIDFVSAGCWGVAAAPNPEEPNEGTIGCAATAPNALLVVDELLFAPLPKGDEIEGADDGDAAPNGLEMDSAGFAPKIFELGELETPPKPEKVDDPNVGILFSGAFGEGAAEADPKVN